jgi:hypothetical protein
MVHAAWGLATIFRMSLLARCESQNIVNVFHIEATPTHEVTLDTDAKATASGANLAADWNTSLKTAFLAQLPTDYSLQVVRVQVVERPNQVDRVLLASDIVTGLPAPGTNGAVADDMTTAAVIKWKTLQAGRHSRGRTYIGPLNDTQTTLGILNTPTPFNAFKDAMITRYTGAGAGVTAGWAFTVYSRPYNAPHGAYTIRVPGQGLTVVNNTVDYNGTSTYITGGQVDLTLRTQRRRQLGVGS